MTVHDLQGSSGAGRVAQVLVAGDASYAGGEDRGAGRVAGRGTLRGQAAEETAAGFLHGVQLPAGDAILLLDVLAGVQGCRPSVPVDANGATGRTETAVQIHLGRDVHLSCTRGLV